MLRFGAVAAALLGLSGVAAADPPPGDLGLLQGYWKPLRVEFEGKPQMTADQMQNVTVVIENAEYHLYFVDRTGPEPRPLRLALVNVSLDPTTTPKTIVMEFAAGPLKGQKRHGIYEVTGNQLKLCYGPQEKPKPTAFVAPPNSGYFLEVWGKQPK
jgi:uncharacterized protein (TIGR03067 family)